MTRERTEARSGEAFIAKAEGRREFVTGDDGYVVYWPNGCNGAFSAWVLRAFADELDRRNAVWDAQVQADCAIAEPLNGKREAAA